jgi:hypothetical protein
LRQSLSSRHIQSVSPTEPPPPLSHDGHHRHQRKTKDILRMEPRINSVQWPIPVRICWPYCGHLMYLTAHCSTLFCKVWDGFIEVVFLVGLYAVQFTMMHILTLRYKCELYNNRLIASVLQNITKLLQSMYIG